MVLHLTKSNDAAVNESEGKDSQHQIQPETDMHAALGYNPYEPHQEADNDKRITERTEQSYPLAPAAITDEIESGIGHEIFDRCIKRMFTTAPIASLLARISNAICKTKWKVSASIAPHISHRDTS